MLYFPFLFCILRHFSHKDNQVIIKAAQFHSCFDTGLQIYGGRGHCPTISKYGQLLSKAVGPGDPSFLVVKKSHFNNNKK